MFENESKNSVHAFREGEVGGIIFGTNSIWVSKQMPAVRVKKIVVETKFK